MNIEFSTKRSKNSSNPSLSVKGELTVQHSVEFKDYLTKHLHGKNDLDLSLAEVQSIDVSAIQLIYGLKMKMEASGRKLNLVHPLNESVINLLQKTGFVTILS